MVRYAAGIDCGSSFCKGALIRDEGPGSPVAIEKLVRIPTGWNIGETGAVILKQLLAGLSQEAVVLTATGYGRERIPGRDKTITEISAHARGAAFLIPGVRTLIDIGGQDCKVISVEAGKVIDFQMNDKCAAGSGRFLETVCRRLRVEAAQMENLLGEGKSVALNSTCAVFAESEIIGLLARGVSREEILGGAAASMAARLAALAARLTPVEPAALSGGLSGSAGIAGAVSRALGITVQPLEQGANAGALGAALAGLE
jgi:predicted CoA-substrate-specific enzyme activase